jgi:maltose alpha-D-glucosyltransferase / alpha-amylase
MTTQWYKNAIFYEVYLRAYCDSNADGNGDLPGLITKLDYLAELGVNCIWLLPIYPSPLKDDGYDIADYFGISSEYGTLEDFSTLLVEAHRREMYIIMDLVLNHTSDQHPWFQAARFNRDSPFRDYYVWSDTKEKYSQARIIFLDTQESNWTWDEEAGQYYWHRFYASQPDLNFDNSKVPEEMLNVVRFWLEIGIDGFRVDAVPYLYEREGTNCENLPETHLYLKRLRAFVEANFPGRVLLCEANQWPEDVRPYFGDGDEFQMGFHFPLMPRIFMAIERSDKSPIVWAFDRTPPIPDDCQWCIFLRNHDELTLEMVTEEERQWMWDEFAPNPRMRLNLGIRRRLAPLLDNDRRKIELANSLLFSLPGTPVIYYGDEIGMGDDIWLPDRNGVRTPMQWENSLSAGFSTSPPTKFYSPVIWDKLYSPQRVNVADQMQSIDSLWNNIRNMIAIRKSFPVFGSGQFRWITHESNAFAAYWRQTIDHQVLIINNLSPDKQTLQLELGKKISGLDLLTHQGFQSDAGGDLVIELKPYGYQWIEIKANGNK